MKWGRGRISVARNRGENPGPWCPTKPRSSPDAGVTTYPPITQCRNRVRLLWSGGACHVFPSPLAGWCGRSGIAKPDPRIPHSTQRTHLASSGHARDSTRGVTLHDLLFNVAPFPSRASIREVPSCRIAHRPDRTRHDRGLPRDTSPRWASIIWRLPLLSSRCFTRPQGPRAHSPHDGDGRTGARPALHPRQHGQGRSGGVLPDASLVVRLLRRPRRVHGNPRL